jgi:WD40 repeat protein
MGGVISVGACSYYDFHISMLCNPKYMESSSNKSLVPIQKAGRHSSTVMRLQSRGTIYYKHNTGIQIHKGLKMKRDSVFIETRLLLVLFAVASLGVACSPTPTSQPTETPLPVPTSFGGGSGRIAFFSDRDGNREIYVMNADGSEQINLTNNPAADEAPVWSPDGTRIAFLSDRNGNREIYVMKADGSEQTNLTNHPSDHWGFAWSPDGTRIAFTSDRDGNYEIYVMGVEGSGVTRLTDSPAGDVLPTWSPDGTRIAFQSDRDGKPEIYVMNADGLEQTNLTNHPPEPPLFPTPESARVCRPGGGQTGMCLRHRGLCPPLPLRCPP